MAPEMLRDDLPVSSSADIFSIGRVLHEMATQAPPAAYGLQAARPLDPAANLPEYLSELAAGTQIPMPIPVGWGDALEAALSYCLANDAAIRPSAAVLRDYCLHQLQLALQSEGCTFSLDAYLQWQPLP